MTATTALTAQNTHGVYGIHETPSDFVQKQIVACIEDIGVDVLKTGTPSTSSDVNDDHAPEQAVLTYARHARFDADCQDRCGCHPPVPCAGICSRPSTQ